MIINHAQYLCISHLYSLKIKPLEPYRICSCSIDISRERTGGKGAVWGEYLLYDGINYHNIKEHVNHPGDYNTLTQ